MDLLKFLKENEKSRKIFGKRELVIIEKQLQGINLTQSEKNRLSRDIREKLRFIKEVSKFESEFELKKSKLSKEKIKQAKEEILKDQLADKIKEIWLFGSIIENKFSFRSDIDLVVLFDKITKKEAFLFRARISGRVSDKIEVQVFDVLPEKIKQDILKKHEVLYKK
ncbi:MAG: nucleotidyltransferase domain-containing protein [Nanoarchaeota archaeon]